MSRSKGILTQYQFPLFFLLAYALSWWSAPFAGGAIIPYGPALAAVIILALTEGRQGLRGLWRRVTQWRAGWWYLIGPAIIAAYLLAAYAINILLGAAVSEPPRLPPWGVLLQLALLGGMWEEPGWSGYALPALQDRFADRRYGPLAAALIVGVGRSIWHLPLLLSGAIPWYDVFIFSIAFQFIISWLYNRSGGSVPAVMLFHFMSNVLAGSIMLPVFSGSAKTTFYVLFVACACLIALAIAWQSRLRFGWRSAGQSLQT